ncbi:MAG TPA: hypothetical protein VL987_11975 [Cellvibrio sp.]|nr:hypothetical protein [Cellvibrio sp.]
MSFDPYPPKIQHPKTRNTLVISILLLVLISWLGKLDELSTEYIDDSLVKSTVAFGVARTLNAVISVCQSITFGVGMTVTVGEALNPINNLVEDYASLMKLAIGSLIIQKLLVEIVSDTLFKILLSVSGVLLLIGFYFKNGMHLNFLSRLFLFFLFIRFSLAFVIIMNSFVDHAFLNEKTQDDVEALSSLSHDIDTANQIQKISVADNKALSDQLLQLNAEEQSISSLLKKQHQLLEDANDSVNKADENVRNAEEKLSLMQRLSDKDLSSLKSTASAKKKSLQLLEEQIEELEENMEAIQERKTYIENTLAGKPNSIMESIGMTVSDSMSSVKSLGDKFNALAMVDKLEGAINGILNLMTLFLLKTMILPLIFLFALSKVTKSIWAIDVREILTNPSTPRIRD